MFTRILAAAIILCYGLIPISTLAAEAKTYGLGDWLYQVRIDRNTMEVAQLRACHPYDNSFTIAGATGTSLYQVIWTLRVRVGDVFLLPNMRNPERSNRVVFISMNTRDCTGIFAGITE